MPVYGSRVDGVCWPTPPHPATTLTQLPYPCTLRLLCLQAQQLAATVDAQQIQALALQPPPQRQLVSYEDL